MITDEALQEYSIMLQQNGFDIWEPKSTSSYFVYSREWKDQTCFGMIQKSWTGTGYEHLMPIKPSKLFGGSMYVSRVPNELTLESAKEIALPMNWNSVIGHQYNYWKPYSMDAFHYRRAVATKTPTEREK